MTDATIAVHVPAPLLQFSFDESEIQRRVAEWLVLSLFTEGHISSGKAASLLGRSRIEFLALLRARGIAYLNFTREELEEEFEAAKSLEVKPNE